MEELNSLAETDYRLPDKRRSYLEDRYGIDLLSDDSDDERDAFDPLNPNWIKKERDLAEERKLKFSTVRHLSGILEISFGIVESFRQL